MTANYFVNQKLNLVVGKLPQTTAWVVLYFGHVLCNKEGFLLKEIWILAFVISIVSWCLLILPCWNSPSFLPRFLHIFFSDAIDPRDTSYANLINKASFCTIFNFFVSEKSSFIQIWNERNQSYFIIILNNKFTMT